MVGSAHCTRLCRQPASPGRAAGLTPKEPGTQTLAPGTAPQPELLCRVMHLPEQENPHVSPTAPGERPAMPYDASGG